MKNKYLVFFYLLLLLPVLFSACNRKQYVAITPIVQPKPDSTFVFKIPVDTSARDKNIVQAPPLVNPETYYTYAYNELKAMLDDKQRLNFKRAVFITENAYCENQLHYKGFCDYISALSKIANEWSKVNKLQDYKFVDTLNIALNGGIFHTLTDTVWGANKSIINVPYKYDFNDCFAKKEWTNMFVTKLLITHKGNCHSLPFLYKIIAEESGAKVWLSYTPNHIYLRNWCKKTGWYNTELTSAMFPSEAWVMTSGYVSVNSIISGIYMDTLGLKQSIAVCVNDLAKGYQRKFKNADLQFILNCCDLGLKYYPNFGELLLLKAETHKKVYEREIASTQLTEQYAEKTKYHLSEMNSTYDLLAKLDYREIPEAMFLEWIKSLENNKEKYQDKKISDTFKTENK